VSYVLRVSALYPELAKLSEHIKWRFSATAICINFLQWFTIEQRKHVRRTCLQEDFQAACVPERHIRGLNPYCIDNPQLRIEQHIGFWTNILPGDWRDPSLRLSQVAADVILPRFTAWLNDIISLPSLGLPDHALVVHFDVTCSKPVRTRALLKEAACMQETMAAWCANHSVQPPVDMKLIAITIAILLLIVSFISPCI
jgi:hypothetical protein